MLTHDDVRGILSRLKADADRADEALAAGDGIPPLELAAAVELGKLATSSASWPPGSRLGVTVRCLAGPDECGGWGELPARLCLALDRKPS
jgi:hypothetical protein